MHTYVLLNLSDQSLYVLGWSVWCAGQINGVEFLQVHQMIILLFLFFCPFAHLSICPYVPFSFVILPFVRL